MGKLYGDGMTDAEYHAYLAGLPAWQRRALFTLAVAPFVGMPAVMVLGAVLRW